MPLLTESPPKGAEKVLKATVSELVGHGAIALGTRSSPAVSMPVRVFNMGADAIAAGKGLAAAQPTGWKVQLAVLRVPALYLLALWLKDDNGDRLVPIPPSPRPLKAGESYPAGRALDSLQQAAKLVLEGDSARS